MATDFDRNRNAMITAGRIKPDASKIVWTSYLLPNDAFASPATASAEMTKQIHAILTAITPKQALLVKDVNETKTRQKRDKNKP